MKLQEYFNQKRDYGLSDIQRIDVYQAIMDKKMKKSFHRKRSFLHVKSFVYTSFLLFFILGFYGMYFFQEKDVLDMDAYMISYLLNNNTAQADFVAKVVEFNGAFDIEQGGKSIQTSNIKDGDIVSLKSNTQMIFHIDNDTKAKIIGPAKFVINKKAEGSYKVELLYGEYIEISSLQKENKHNIEVAFDNIVVSQGENKKPIDFQLVKQGENHIIKNNGAKLLVSSNENEQTSISNKQVLAIQGNDISLFDDFDKFTKAVKDRNLSQTFTFTDPDKLDISYNIDGVEKVDEIKILEIEEILDIDEKDLPDIDLGLIDNQQKVATPEQIKTIDGQLYKEFVYENIDLLITSYKELNVVDFNRSFNDLEKRVSAIAKTFQYEYISPKGSESEKVSGLVSLVDELEKHISQNYLLPPKYLENLKYISSSLFVLKGVPFTNSDIETEVSESL